MNVTRSASVQQTQAPEGKAVEDDAMYVAQSNIAVQPDKLEEMLRVLQDQVVPAAKQTPGCKSLRVLVDRKTSRVIVSAVYDTEANAQATAMSPHFKQVMEQIAPLLKSELQRVIYELVIDV